MPPHEKEPAEIRPAAPDPILGELLSLPLARICPLRAGDTVNGCAREGEYLLAAAVKGQLTLTCHSQYALLSPGQVMVLLAPGNYAFQGVSDSLAMAVHLRGELPGRMLGELLRNEGKALLSGGGPMLREAVLALAVLEDEGGPVPASAASAAAYTMLAKLREQKAGDAGGDGAPSLVESAVAIIQEDFPYLEGLDELAERLEVSKAHLIRCFTKTVGMSPGKYITRVKVEYAKLLLQGEEPSVAYVAEASGFANANYFAKVFRKETGMTPSEYLQSSPRQTQEQRELAQRDRKAIW